MRTILLTVFNDDKDIVNRILIDANSISAVESAVGGLHCFVYIGGTRVWVREPFLEVINKWVAK